MSHFLSYAIPGIPYGCNYALMAVGLVLTFRATGRVQPGLRRPGLRRRLHLRSPGENQPPSGGPRLRPRRAGVLPAARSRPRPVPVPVHPHRLDDGQARVVAGPAHRHPPGPTHLLRQRPAAEPPQPVAEPQPRLLPRPLDPDQRRRGHHHPDHRRGGGRGGGHVPVDRHRAADARRGREPAHVAARGDQLAAGGGGGVGPVERPGRPGRRAPAPAHGGTQSDRSAPVHRPARGGPHGRGGGEHAVVAHRRWRRASASASSRTCLSGYLPSGGVLAQTVVPAFPFVVFVGTLLLNPGLRRLELQLRPVGGGRPAAGTPVGVDPRPSAGGPHAGGLLGPGGGLPGVECDLGAGLLRHRLRRRPVSVDRLLVHHAHHRHERTALVVPGRLRRYRRLRGGAIRHASGPARASRRGGGGPAGRGDRDRSWPWWPSACRACCWRS